MVPYNKLISIRKDENDPEPEQKDKALNDPILRESWHTEAVTKELVDILKNKLRHTITTCEQLNSLPGNSHLTVVRLSEALTIEKILNLIHTGKYE